ncbi:MAG: hypothetical protein OHK0040_04390 [bacterium]
MKRLLLFGLLFLTVACNGSEKQTGKSSITGTVYKPIPQAYIYVYKEGMDMKGPAFTDVVADSNGSFSIQLPPGKYFLVARMRKTGEVAGPLEVGDLKSEVIGPITVKDTGEMIKTDIKVFEKKGEAKDIAINTATEEKKTVISGYIFDADGKPVQNARVHVYDHVQMSERPKFVSSPTGPDGKYSIALPKGGTYYLAARDKFGGPPKVGDLYGRYDRGTIEPSGISIRDNEVLENINITVHRVW